MAAVNDKPTSSAIVVCGRGRIGEPLMRELQAQSLSVCQARLDSLSGLYAKDGQLSKKIKLLIICISAGHKGQSKPRWQWRDIFSGLTRQIQDSELVINNIVMVSSTRVYEAIEQGIVTAETEAKAASPQGKGLIAAEQALQTLPAKVLILRASGLYGDKYPKYGPILLAGKDKPRFGIDSNKVVERLRQAVQEVVGGQFESSVELMTDGKVYFEGKQFFWPDDRESIESLAKEERILVSSKKRIC